VNLLETIKLIQDTAKDTVAAKLIPLPNDPETHLLITGGQSQTIKTPFVPSPRRHTVESVESFAAAFHRWAIVGSADDDAGTPMASANMWIDLTGWNLSFYTDEPLRRCWVKLELAPSPQLQLLQKFEKPVPVDQRTLVRMLRHDLAECVEPGVLAAFRSIDFQKIVNARQNIQHEKQSLDSDIIAQVSGEKKPDAFTVSFPLFAMRELAHAVSRVGITIDIECDDRKFILQAKPGHLEMALDDARAAVINKLEAELADLQVTDVVILAGTPNGRE
jgi:hypothetical protein